MSFMICFDIINCILLNESHIINFLNIFLSGNYSGFFEEIKNGTLNYYNSVLKDETITVTGNKANIKGKTTLKAKVYGTEGEWTLPTDANFEKINGKWLFCN